MGLAYALLTNQFHFYFLAWSQFSYQYIIKERFNAIFSKSLFLITNRDPFQLAWIHICVIVKFILIHSIVNNSWCLGIFLSASNMEFEFYGVVFIVDVLLWLLLMLITVCLLRSLLFMELKLSRICLDGNQSHAMCQVFIWNNGCILPHVNFLNGHSGYLCD